MIEFLHQIDSELFMWLNSRHSHLFDRIMFFISGRWEWIPLYAVLLGFIVWRYRWKSLWILLAVAILITVSDQLTNILKAAVRRPRPCKDPVIGQMVLLVNDYCSGMYGFVSAHASNTFALATFISLLFRNRWVTTGMLFWASVVSYSRIYLGVHYPGDIICGALLGVLLAWGICYILNRLIKPVQL
ncbi:MAG: phosphatase PAP2 family protein [Bacteroidales bacterium]|nr:phosphatase PAP2 family protein [Bacteroidales bacterium]